MPDEDRVIIKAMVDSNFTGQSEVKVQYNDKSIDTIFHYYSDELSFHPEEFIGLTKSQALDIRRKKDIAYLQS